MATMLPLPGTAHMRPVPPSSANSEKSGSFMALSI
jgi:hypothetical protein